VNPEFSGNLGAGAVTLVLETDRLHLELARVLPPLLSHRSPPAPGYTPGLSRCPFLGGKSSGPLWQREARKQAGPNYAS
jgi:hypothetical protein